MGDRPACEYLEAPDVMVRINAVTGREERVNNPPRFLCTWGVFASRKLEHTPTWLRREAGGGHLWRQGDCDACPCYVAELRKP